MAKNRQSPYERLTPRQRRLYRRYTKTEHMFMDKKKRVVALRIEHQSFVLHNEMENKRHCEWLRSMLAFALDRLLEKEQA